MHALFPGALPSRAVLHRSAELLHAKLGATPSNTIYADSVCPDEINHEESALPFVMAQFWGRRAFPMGGLAGVPFVGKTGFFAFSHHVPEDGNVLILFGPHVGISESGELGKHHRLGQSCESSACGAVLAAYNKCKNAPCKPCDEVRKVQQFTTVHHSSPFPFCDLSRPNSLFVFAQESLADEHDMQQSWITKRVGNMLKDVEASNTPLAALVHSMYTEIEKEVLAIVDTNFGNIILLGGVQINLPYPYECHWQPLYFKAWSKATASTPMDLSYQSYSTRRRRRLSRRRRPCGQELVVLDVTPRRSRRCGDEIGSNVEV